MCTEHITSGLISQRVVDGMCIIKRYWIVNIRERVHQLHSGMYYINHVQWVCILDKARDPVPEGQALYPVYILYLDMVYIVWHHN